MIAAFFKAWDDLWSPRFRAVLWQCLGLSVVTAALVLAGVWWLVAGTELIGSVPWVGDALEVLVDVLGWVAAFLLMLLLLPAFLGLYASFYIETICRAVEARHYPGLPPAREQSVGEAVSTGVKFLFVLIAANLVILPLIFIPPVYAVAGWAINGHLLGREYMEMVGFRRLDPKALAAFRARHRNRIFLGGLLLAAVATVPILNLFLPLVGTAFMVHLYQSLAGRA